MSQHVNNYIHSEAIHNTNAAEAFLPILLRYISPNTVVDIGCGLGTWLKVFKKHGVIDVLGVDGNYINQNDLQIDKSEFLLHDLSKPLLLSKKYALAICLEVAEHLPETAADTIVSSLISASDTILFSAALPLQGGQNHINEQSFNYWKKKFNNKGFIVKDIFRQEIWDNQEIDWWYRQNIFLVIKSNEIQEEIHDYYHPERYIQISEELDYCKQQLSNFYQGNISIKQGIKTLVKSILNIGK